ncbi:hypothetical protein AX17_005101 [Amanita inopinata Kibby_2008]|nr:hypothetical protein AX17_005101 [Amanita inopinata Kibby_2008]
MPDNPLGGEVRVLGTANWLGNAALRDLVFHVEHAACVDARGDVYQWGDRFFGALASQSQKPQLTLKGKNIKQIQLTESKVYALSESGKVYILSSISSNQHRRTGSLSSARNSWWGAEWIWGKGDSVDFVEVVPREKLAWNERIASIAAGDSHLLAITSKGRTFAHPIDVQANQYGQLGLRKVDVRNGLVKENEECLTVDLIPKSFARLVGSSHPNHKVQHETVSDELSRLDDKSIRFCPYLFEIPALKGVPIEQVAAGARNSFARTKTGQVLAWGANEYGQLGLGSNVTLDTITVPTEVVLCKPSGTQTRCIDVSAGGDLTAFMIERTEESETPLVDLLMCGNGQWGGLGDNTYSTARGALTKAKNVSGLLEYNDQTRALQPISPQSVAVSPSGHVLLTLDTSKSPDGVGGRDLIVWGRNIDGELGNGKRSGLAVPTALEGARGERVMLRERKAVVWDLRGQVWQKGVRVEQTTAVGYGNSAVYWRII